MHDKAPGFSLPQQDQGLGEGGAVSQGAAHPLVGHQGHHSMAPGSAPSPDRLALHVEARPDVDLSVGAHPYVSPPLACRPP